MSVGTWCQFIVIGYFQRDSVGTWCQLIVIGYFRRDSVGTWCQLIVIGYFRRDNVSTWCQFIFRSDAGLYLMTLMDGSYSWGDKPNDQVLQRQVGLKQAQ